MGSTACPPCDIHRFNIYCPEHHHHPHHRPIHLDANKKKRRQQQQHTCLCVRVALRMLALHVSLHAACLSGHQEQDILTLMAPLLRVQGCCAITKTALSITLTDRLKRGFNSYSSPRALHHRGRHPSPPRLPSLSLAFYRRLLSITPGSRGKNGPRCSCRCTLPHPPPLSDGLPGSER